MGGFKLSKLAAAFVLGIGSVQGSAVGCSSVQSVAQSAGAVPVLYSPPPSFGVFPAFTVPARGWRAAQSARRHREIMRRRRANRRAGR